MDSGIVIEYNYEEAKRKSEFIQETLTKFISTRLKTRLLYKSFELWDKTFNIGNYNDTVDEILFWKFNLVKYNNKVINCYNIPFFHVHSDASNTEIACVFDVRGKRNICYRNLTDLEKTFSSTWRKLVAIRFSLLSSIKQFENKCIFWYTDNFSTQQIIKCGSNKTHIRSLALNIFNFNFEHNMHLEVSWVGREYNKEADKISKTVDFGD